MRLKSPFLRLEHTSARIRAYNDMLDKHAQGAITLTDAQVGAVKDKIYTLYKRANALERKLAWRNIG